MGRGASPAQARAVPQIAIGRCAGYGQNHALRRDARQELEDWSNQYILSGFFKEDQTQTNNGNKKYVRSAERFALWYLRLKGYRLLAWRYRSGAGVVDPRRAVEPGSAGRIDGQRRPAMPRGRNITISTSTLP